MPLALNHRKNHPGFWFRGKEGESQTRPKQPRSQLWFMNVSVHAFCTYIPALLIVLVWATSSWKSGWRHGVEIPLRVIQHAGQRLAGRKSLQERSFSVPNNYTQWNNTETTEKHTSKRMETLLETRNLTREPKGKTVAKEEDNVEPRKLLDDNSLPKQEWPEKTVNPPVEGIARENDSHVKVCNEQFPLKMEPSQCTSTSRDKIDVARTFTKKKLSVEGIREAKDVYQNLGKHRSYEAFPPSETTRQSKVDDVGATDETKEKTADEAADEGEAPGMEVQTAIRRPQVPGLSPMDSRDLGEKRSTKRTSFPDQNEEDGEVDPLISIARRGLPHGNFKEHFAPEPFDLNHIQQDQNHENQEQEQKRQNYEALRQQEEHRDTFIFPPHTHQPLSYKRLNVQLKKDHIDLPHEMLPLVCLGMLFICFTVALPLWCIICRRRKQIEWQTYDMMVQHTRILWKLGQQQLGPLEN